MIEWREKCKPGQCLGLRLGLREHSLGEYYFLKQIPLGRIDLLWQKSITTTTIRGLPVEVELNQDDGMPKPCVVTPDTLVTIRKDLLEARITTNKDEKTNLVHQALKSALAIP